jgi:hypothetical protein
MEFRCYPDDSALGLNSFEIALAANSSARPNFRAFSTGGYDLNQLPVIKNPDLENDATGGYNPGSNPPGATTMGIDNSFYHGQAELVTRIGITHSIWIDTGFLSPDYAPPVVQPGPEDQPAGTSAVLAFRGATSMSGLPAGSNITTNAQTLDFYGDPFTPPMGMSPGAPVFLGGDGTWKSAMSDVNQAQYFQFRLTFISNPISNKTATITGLGFAYAE